MKRRVSAVVLSLAIAVALGATATMAAEEESTWNPPILPSEDTDSSTWVEAWFGGVSGPAILPDQFKRVVWWAKLRIGQAFIEYISEEAFLGFANAAMANGFTTPPAKGATCIMRTRSDITFSGYKGVREHITAIFTRCSDNRCRAFIQYSIFGSK